MYHQGYQINTQQRLFKKEPVMKESKTMTPEQIKKALEAINVSQSGLARDLGITPQVVNKIIHGSGVSHRVRCHVAKAVGRPVEDIWDVTPKKTGRPLGRGLYDREPAVA